MANSMSRGKNKECELLEGPWCEIQTEELQDVQTCVCILTGNENTALVSRGMPELYVDHEDADTQIRCF